MPRKVGKPAFKPTENERRLVEQMSAVGIPHESIAAVVRNGIDDKTLRKHFRKELDTAAVKANAKVAGSLYNRALAGSDTAAIWWTKARMRWSAPQTLEGPDGEELSIKVTLVKPSD